MNPKYLNNYRQRKALREMCGDPFSDLGFALLIRQSEFSQALSEVSVVEYDDLSQVALGFGNTMRSCSAWFPTVSTTAVGFLSADHSSLHFRTIRMRSM